MVMMDSEYLRVPDIISFKNEENDSEVITDYKEAMKWLNERFNEVK